MPEMASLEQAVGEPLVERVARRELEDRGDDPGSPKKKQKSGGQSGQSEARKQTLKSCITRCRMKQLQAQL